jgi:hypothetical protein
MKLATVRGVTKQMGACGQFRSCGPTSSNRSVIEEQKKNARGGGGPLERWGALDFVHPHYYKTLATVAMMLLYGVGDFSVIFICPILEK